MVSVRMLQVDWPIFVVAIQIEEGGDSIFYFDVTDQARPGIFDATLKRQIVPNVDSWATAHTLGRYGLSGLIDMAKSFIDGVRSVYNQAETAHKMAEAAILARKTLFETELAQPFSRLYYIETMSNLKLDALLGQIRTEWDKLSKDKPKLTADLLRLYRFCLYNAKDQAPIIQRLLDRLEVAERIAPTIEADELDKKLIERMMITVPQKVSATILNNVRTLKNVHP